MILKFIPIVPLIVLSTNAFAVTQDKMDVTSIIIIFIVAQVLSIIGIVSLGMKKNKKKKESAPNIGKTTEVKTQVSTKKPISTTKTTSVNLNKNKNSSDDGLDVLPDIDFPSNSRNSNTISKADVSDAIKVGSGNFSGGGASSDIDFDINTDIDIDF